VKFGLTIFPTAETIQPAAMARLAESHGFESLWFPEHTHIPVSRDTPYPGGGELPDEYARIYDPFVALTAAAAATERPAAPAPITQMSGVSRSAAIVQS